MAKRRGRTRFLALPLAEAQTLDHEADMDDMQDFMDYDQLRSMSYPYVFNQGFNTPGTYSVHT